jgi:hypothetical protein
MALALAFKRTARFYTPPLRRWVARNVPYLLVWWIGLCTGLYSRPGDPGRVTMIMLGGLAVLTLLRKWAGDASHPDRPG